MRSVPRLLWAVTGLLVAALAGCGSPSARPANTPDRGQPSSAAGAVAGRGTDAAGSSTSSAMQPTGGAALASPHTTGPLTVATSVRVPVDAASAWTATEAPDGAVFVTDPEDGIVWVVDGDGPARVAEHLAGTPNGVAADGTDLYVATGTALFRFRRTTGDEVSQWALPLVTPSASASGVVGVSLAAKAGQVWVLVPAGHGQRVYSLTNGAASSLQFVVRSLGSAVGPDGSLYFESTDGYLSRVAPDGSVARGPDLTSGPGRSGAGVQSVAAVAAGQVWVSASKGNGTGDSYQGFGAATLSPGAAFSSPASLVMTDTAAGPLALALALAGPGPPACPSDAACVARLAANGARSQAVGVGQASELLGPFPVAVGVGPAGAVIVQRLS